VIDVHVDSLRRVDWLTGRADLGLLRPDRTGTRAIGIGDDLRVPIKGRVGSIPTNHITSIVETSDATDATIENHVAVLVEYIKLRRNLAEVVDAEGQPQCPLLS
jgi:hypothetical protein